MEELEVRNSLLRCEPQDTLRTTQYKNKAAEAKTSISGPFNTSVAVQGEGVVATWTEQ